RQASIVDQRRGRDDERHLIRSRRQAKVETRTDVLLRQCSDAPVAADHDDLRAIRTVERQRRAGEAAVERLTDERRRDASAGRAGVGLRAAEGRASPRGALGRARGDEKEREENSWSQVSPGGERQRQ